MDALVRRRNALLFRMPLVAAGVVALFWGGWWFITGEVPLVDSAKIANETVDHLPFAISRWLDIPSAAVFAALGVMVWHAALVIDSDVASFSAILVFALSAVFVFVFAALGADVGIGLGIFFVIVIGVIVGKEEYRRGIAGRILFSGVVALSVGLGSAFVLSGVVGLVITVALALAYAVLSAIVFSAAYGAKKLVQNRRALGRGALDWLFARDVVGGNSQ